MGDKLEIIELEAQPRETLIRLARAYSRNWQTLDGNWFSAVEAAYGLAAAARLDLENWRHQSVLEAKRLTAAMGIQPGTLSAMMQVLSLMSWQLTSPRFVIAEDSPQRVVFYWDRCAVQEGRERGGKPLFECREMKLALLKGLASVVIPEAVVECRSAPPDPPPTDCWCRWVISLP